MNDRRGCVLMVTDGDLVGFFASSFIVIVLFTGSVGAISMLSAVFSRSSVGGVDSPRDFLPRIKSSWIQSFVTCPSFSSLCLNIRWKPLSIIWRDPLLQTRCETDFLDFTPENSTCLVAPTVTTATGSFFSITLIVLIK